MSKLTIVISVILTFRMSNETETEQDGGKNKFIHSIPAEESRKGKFNCSFDQSTEMSKDNYKYY